MRPLPGGAEPGGGAGAGPDLLRGVPGGPAGRGAAGLVRGLLRAVPGHPAHAAGDRGGQQPRAVHRRCVCGGAGGGRETTREN